jgi:transcriptional regulator with XRE-family HTH domain
MKKPNKRMSEELVRLSAVQVIGYEIRRCRHARRLSQRALAELAGTTQTAIAHIEAGSHNPTMGLLERVAAAMRMDVAVALRRKLGE